MNTAMQALEFLTKYEEIKQQAIDELEAAKADIESNLARLKGEATVPPAKRKSVKARVCKVCGSVEHDGRFHRGRNDAADSPSTITSARLA